MASERAEFAGLLRKEVDRYEDMLESGDAARVLAADGPSRLSARLSSLLSGLESELDRVDASIGQKLHCLDLNRDGKLDRAELAGAAAGLLQEALQGVDLRKVLGDAVFDSEGNIKLADLIALAQENDEQNADSATPTVRLLDSRHACCDSFLPANAGGRGARCRPDAVVDPCQPCAAVIRHAHDTPRLRMQSHSRTVARACGGHVMRQSPARPPPYPGVCFGCVRVCGP